MSHFTDYMLSTHQVIEAGRICLLVGERSQDPCCILDRDSNSFLMWMPKLSILTPEIDGRCDWADIETKFVDHNKTQLRFSEDFWGYYEIHIVPVPAHDALDFTLHLHPNNDCQLDKVHCFSSDTKLNFHKLINYRNRHYTDTVWPELLLGADECQTDTTSRDWQFAPHPTLIHFQRHDMYLSFGTMHLPVGTFGMYFKAGKYRVQDWHIDYGGEQHGHPIMAGQTFSSPTFRLRLSEHDDVFDAYADFGSMLKAQGQIPDETQRKQTRQQWWLDPLYCTWVDQCNLASHRPAAELQQQVNSCNHLTRQTHTADMVRQAVKVICEHDLPFRTILLDEGWHRARGWWEPHPDRFPDMRALVDELHDQGFKVVIWWAWPEIEKAAEPHIPKQWLMGQGQRNRHDCLMYDFSNPAVQENYLKPLFYKLFSSDESCFDLDGIKTDFMADKIHADMPISDQTWRGEENYLLQVHQLFYTQLKLNKPDAVHIGCAGHYWCSQYIDINRTYDVHSSNILEHENRARMLKSTSPDCPVAYDFHNFNEHMNDYFASALRSQCSVQIGNVLTCQDNMFAKVRTADINFLEQLANGLKSLS